MPFPATVFICVDLRASADPILLCVSAPLREIRSSPTAPAAGRGIRLPSARTRPSEGSGQGGSRSDQGVTLHQTVLSAAPSLATTRHARFEPFSTACRRIESFTSAMVMVLLPVWLIAEATVITQVPPSVFT